MENSFKQALIEIVGDQCVKTDATSIENYRTDWTSLPSSPVGIVLPKSTEEVALVVQLCEKQGVKLVASGGRTGLAGGATAPNGELILSLEKMNQIIEIDVAGMTLTTQAGVILEEIHNAAEKNGLFFPLNLGAKGSCHIGGNISTNAGGIKFIRYGGARDMVLGLEVVTTGGQVLQLGNGLRKDNSGYDLKQLFIGAEGTLGVVTKVTLKLFQKPKDRLVSLCALDSIKKIPNFITELNQSGITINALEFFSKQAHEKVLRYGNNPNSPFNERHPYYVLMELESKETDESLEKLLEKLLESATICDAVLASNSKQISQLWSFRENITESLAAHGHVRKNDISVRVKDLADFIGELENIVFKDESEVEVIVFGHIGDGNIHINYIAEKTLARDKFMEVSTQMERKVFRLIKDFSGSISAEHGIGVLKTSDLHYSRSETEVEVMRKIKKALDPHNTFNPGKIFNV